MNWKIALFVAYTIIALIFWFLITDLIYCALAFRFELFQWPFTIWLEDFPARNHTQWTTLRYWGSALLPLALFGRVLWLSRARLWPHFPGLYGNSHPASWWDMFCSGIRHRRKPF